MSAFILVNYEKGIMDSIVRFSHGVIFISLFWGMIVLIPTSWVQILCARALAKADCKNYQRFLVGLLNPSIAVSILVILGLLMD
jgi:hypothetical protein